MRGNNMDCDHAEKVETIRVIGVHHSDIHCVRCGKHLGFGKKPMGDEKPKRKMKNLVSKYSDGFCECCLRYDYDLPNGQTLHAHHIIPDAYGGSDKRHNIWIVCTFCHSLIERQRTYLGHYKKNKFKDEHHMNSQQ